MSYSCLEELQIAFDLNIDDKINKIDILSNIGRRYKDGWLAVTDDGMCHLFDKDGNLDDIKKVTRLNEKHIRQDIKKIIIPDSVIHIEDGIFDGCNHLTSVIISGNVTRIGSDTFQNCLNLTSVTIPDSVTSIGEGAFCYCTMLTSMMIPDSVKKIDQQAFLCCSSLTNVMIPSSMTSIGDDAFADCSNLANVTIHGNIKRIGSYAFSYCDNLRNLTFKCKTLKQVKKMDNYPWGIEDESIIQVE